jgi:hypothetical protein
MESELERFNKQNVQLELNNKEKESRLEATQKELKDERSKVKIRKKDFNHKININLLRNGMLNLN